MKDTPRSSQHCFVLFSVRGTPMVKIAPAIEAMTGVTLSGDYEDDIIKIEASGSGFIYTTKVEKQNTSGSFAVTAVSNGSAAENLESDTKVFTFEVIVFGNDHPGFLTHFYEVNYMESVDFTPSIICAAPFKDCCAINGGMLKDNDGYESGLTVTGVFNEEGTAQIAQRVSGTALRPGVYCFAIEATSHYRNPGDRPFVDGSNVECIIVSIRKPEYSSGDLVVLADIAEYKPTEGRLEVAAHKLDPYKCEHLPGVFTGLERTHVINHDTYQDKSEFKFVKSDNHWQLWARRYFSDELTPEYTMVATAPDMLFDNIESETPPKCGWSGGVVLVGNTQFCVAGYGLFDVAGTHPVYGIYYQRQTTYTPQWPGWVRPPEYQNTGGEFLYQSGPNYYLSHGNPPADGVKVTAEAVTGGAIPYAPPRKKDIALENLNVNKKVQNLCLTGSGDDTALGFFKQYQWRRQIPPPDGVEPIPDVTVNVSATKTTTSSSKYKSAHSQQGGGPWDAPLERFDSFSAGSSSSSANISMSGSIKGLWAVNDRDAIAAIFGNSGEGEITYSYQSDTDDKNPEGSMNMNNITDPFTPIRGVVSSSSETQGIDSVTQKNMSFGLFIGSGPNPASQYQELFVSAVGSANIGASTSGSLYQKIDAGGENTYEGTVPRTGSVSLSAIIQSGCGDFIGSEINNISLPNTQRTIINASCTIYEHFANITFTETEIGETVSLHRNISAAHSHTHNTINGKTVKSGETTKTEDGVTTKFDDPDGTVYAGILANADDFTDFSGVQLNQSRTYHVTQTKTTETQTINSEEIEAGL